MCYSVTMQVYVGKCPKVFLLGDKRTRHLHFMFESLSVSQMGGGGGGERES